MSKHLEITERSRVPLYLLFCAIGATISIVTLLVNINWRIAELDRDVRNGWTLHDQEVWSLKLSKQNPALNVPDPLDVVRNAAGSPDAMAALPVTP